MMTKLIKRTCRTSCALFDSITGECGVYEKIDPDHPRTVYICPDYIYDEPQPFFEESDEKDYALLENGYYTDYSTSNDEEMSLNENSNYPISPDVLSGRNDAIWFTSSDQTFGCWIITKYKSRFFKVNDSLAQLESNVYRSPYPLHAHKSKGLLASRVCWYINEEGWGRYTVLFDGEILPYIDDH
ncbi:hypothetical protein MUN89_18020 [Halobacillus salinarum]|uniref:Uncharacterized protein n=1 Tax=Halobacillus salinarum TaxID=2932257 RepID=A0ABY4EIQ4_9BACI|nr:hypothetical protein [Halobacillus salinarum]UOQ43758.1 hypothetical protein MUN89_18020 [Halobacillus salinarum]